MSATADGTPRRTIGDEGVELTFADTSCLRPLRQTIREMLTDADEETLVDAELIATELVANALEHADGPRSVEIRRVDPGRLSITVVDGSPDAHLTVGTSRLGTHRGRGLTIVAATTLWNVTRTATSKAVAAMLTVRPA